MVRPKPAPDIDGRLVAEHELVKYDTSKPTDPQVRWEMATVTRMVRKVQIKNPTYYNVKPTSSNLVTKSVELLPGGTWMVMRRNKWWSSSEGRPTPDAQALEEQEEQEQDGAEALEEQVEQEQEGAQALEGQEEREQEEQEGARPLEGQEEREQEAAQAPEERLAPDAQEEPQL